MSPFVTELPEDDAKILRDKGNEYGTTTGRARRVGWLDLVQVRQAARVSGLTDIAVTKLDILSGYDTVRVCAAYDIDGVIHREMPASLEKIRRAKPVYEFLPGWSDIPKNPTYDTLSATLRDYLRYIEEHTGCRASIISTGPRRDETIVRA
jgi:adenylosuccinate synthase